MGAICEGGCPGGFWAGSTPVELTQGQLRSPFKPGDRRPRGKKETEASSRPTAPHIADFCPTQVPPLPLVCTASGSSIDRRTMAPPHEAVASSYQ